MDIGERDFVKKKSYQSTHHQVRGVEICKALGSKDYVVFISLYKRYPQLCEQAMSWVSDYPTNQPKYKLFLWKIKQLRKPK